MGLGEPDLGPSRMPRGPRVNDTCMWIAYAVAHLDTILSVVRPPRHNCRRGQTKSVPPSWAKMALAMTLALLGAAVGDGCAFGIANAVLRGADGG